MSGNLEHRALQLLNREAAPSGLIRFPMNCSVYVRPFLVVATPEDAGKVLRLLRSEIAQAGGGAASMPPAALGAFGFRPGDWTGCPWCLARDNPAYGLHMFWQCYECRDAGRPSFNCAGCDHQGRFLCACGLEVVNPDFELQETFNVHGQREAARVKHRPQQDFARAAGAPHPMPSYGSPPPMPRNAPAVESAGVRRLKWKG
jgi:hypothetical protein